MVSTIINVFIPIPRERRIFPSWVLFSHLLFLQVSIVRLSDLYKVRSQLNRTPMSLTVSLSHCGYMTRYFCATCPGANEKDGQMYTVSHSKWRKGVHRLSETLEGLRYLARAWHQLGSLTYTSFSQGRWPLGYRAMRHIGKAWNEWGHFRKFFLGT